ncbi:MAG TPA: hypothetical protein VFA70_04285 [Dehalococcoidia bacterium]|nr:hypothetical protein [Dehalococcoidia bacterium]
MPWFELKAIRDAQRAWEQSYYSLPPDACPFCGEPLDVGRETEPGGGKLQFRHCNAGHYEWHGGRRLT